MMQVIRVLKLILDMDRVAPIFFPSNDIVDISMKKSAIDSTIEYYKFMAISYPFVGLTMVSSRAMQAVGVAWPMMIITFSRVIVLQCSLCYVFIILFKKDVYWAWIAISISCIIAGLIAYFMRLYFINKLISK